MADYGVTSTGFTNKPLSVIIEEMQDNFDTVFGQDINTDAGSPEGNIIEIVANKAKDLWDVGEQSYNAFNPNATSETSLDNIVALNDIEREDAQYSSTTLTWDGTSGTTIPAGTQINSDPSLTTDVYSFLTTEELILVGDTALDTVNALCTVTGAILLSPATITILSQPIPGVTSVTNEDSTVPGQDVETDPELRARRDLLVATPAVSIVDSIYAGIIAIASINSALVLENSSSSSSSVEGITLEPHSVKVITYGANDATERASIAKAIYDHKDPGIPTYGSETESVEDSQGFSHAMKWDVPTGVEVYIIINTNAYLNDFSATGASDIRDAIVDYMASADTGTELGKDVSYARLFTPVNSVENHFVQSMYIGTSATPTGTSDITINADEIALFLDTKYGTGDDEYYIQVNVNYVS